jgi:FkbM family methyltransferase
MIKEALSEVLFRLGRSRKSEWLLRHASRLHAFEVRRATELAALGDAEPLGRCTISCLTALRDRAGAAALGPDERAFLAMATRILPSTRAQMLQDAAVLALRGKLGQGYFVEVGTGDGERHSNTVMLERQHGWQGLVIEPDRRFHASIRSCRTATLVTQPAFSRDGAEVEFLEAASSGTLSGLRGSADDGRSRTGVTYSTKAMTLNSILDANGAPKTIDYLSIDTEGSEVDVLNGIDLDRWDVRFMTIEHNFVPGKRERIVSMLAPHGFRPVLGAFSSMDVWLAKRS